MKKIATGPPKFVVSRVKTNSTISSFAPRYYNVEGVSSLFPSVTTILDVINKPFLTEWSKKMALDSVRDAFERRKGQEIGQEWLSEVLRKAASEARKNSAIAADFGTKTHELIEEMLNEDTPPPAIPPSYETVVENFKVWREQCGIRIVETEKMVCSVDHGYAGCIDAVGIREETGGIVVLDWKTSKQLYNEHALQVAAYAKAFEETVDCRVAEAWVIRLDKQAPKFEARQVRNIDATFEVFKNALSLWSAQAAPKAFFFNMD